MNLIEQLKNAAKAQPINAVLFNEAVDEIERLRGERNKIKADAARDAFLEAKIPSRAKAGCIGEFSIHIENGQVCPECYGNEDDPDCEICHGESIDGVSDLTVDIPWITQKEIFKAFCKFATQDYANKLEWGEV